MEYALFDNLCKKAKYAGSNSKQKNVLDKLKSIYKEKNIFYVLMSMLK